MQLDSLSAIKNKKKRRVGRGYGSGRAKTSGRGTKGQKARSKVKKGFEGGQVQLIKRLPYLRGKSKNASQKESTFPLNVEVLNTLPKGEEVTLETLKKHSLIDKRVTRVKILGKGKVTHPKKVHLPCSETAKAAIKKAGGSVTNV